MKLIYRQTSRRSLLIGSAILVPLLALLAALEAGVIESFIITSDSMAPTLQKSDRVIVDLRKSYTPALGDIVTFYNPTQPDRPQLVKRVIGLGGDRIVVRKGRVFRNRDRLIELYVTRPNRTLNLNDSVFKVPPGYFFAAGDNRNFSFDSFNFGPLPLEEIKGHVLFIYAPLGRAGSLKPPAPPPPAADAPG